MNKKCSLVLAILIAFSLPVTAEEGPQVDFILLIDTSLSMAPAIDELKQYVASGIVGRFVQQADWVAVLAFYGKSTLIWEGDINTEADKAALLRSLHALEATGRYTDIGAALDEMKKLVIRRNRPEIPKYILLLTDEVQEAPEGSAYRSDDFTVRHELLEYVRRIDLGSFNAVTIGYGLASRIESDLQALMKTLDDPPERPERFLPGDTQVRTEDPSKPGSGRPAIPGAGDSTKADGTTPGSQEGTGPTAGTPGSGGAGTSASGSQTDSTLPKGDGAGGGTQQSVYLILALVMGIMVLGAILLVIQRAKKPKVAAKRPADKRTVAPTGLKDGRQ